MPDSLTPPLAPDDDGTRQRYFFRGLTEEVVKESVKSSPADDDFTFTLEEDGESASEWYGYYGSPSISAATDTDRHPDGTQKVIFINGSGTCVAVVGDNDAGGYNPNDTAWNSTKRVLSFWYKGGFAPLRVGVTTASGAKELRYWASSGTNSVDGGGNVNIYLGTSAATTTWARFERNIEADWEGVATGVAWQNTDGVAVKPMSTLSYDFWFDDVRLGNAMTVEHNTMGQGVIGHILRHTEIDPTTYTRTDRWFHYDQVGSVLSESDASGALAQRHEQDAFGNVLASWQTGLVGGDRAGWHHNTKEWDGDVGLVYMYQRWYSPEVGALYGSAPLPPMMEHRFAALGSNPISFIDSTGMAFGEFDPPGGGSGGGGYHGDICGWTPHGDPIFCDDLPPSLLPLPEVPPLPPWVPSPPRPPIPDHCKQYYWLPPKPKNVAIFFGLESGLTYSVGLAFPVLAPVTVPVGSFFRFCAAAIGCLAVEEECRK